MTTHTVRTPYRFDSARLTLQYEVQALEAQMKATYQAYREEQYSTDPQPWALDAYRNRLRGLATRRRHHRAAIAKLAAE